jgi:DNA-binding transcriptional regulator YhcF (GntR family)
MSGVNLPRYAQIAAELRDQIEKGTLAPGDRVPSTREITQRWGVAMATATKALAALRQEGIVRPIPGVGTVVGDRQPSHGRPLALASPATQPGPAAARRRGTSDSRLAPDRIVAAAIAVADAEGLAGLSMRRVATENGVATMSLYRHVADKDDLLLKMLDAAFDECRFPARPPAGWRARLELAARTLWAMFQRHPWLAPALSVTRPQPIPRGLACAEWVLSALDGHGLDPSTMLTIYITLVNYVRGTAMNLELEADAEAASGLNSEEWLETQGPALRAIVEAGRFSVFERITATDYDFNLGNLFEFGLQRLLDGLTALIDGHP